MTNPGIIAQRPGWERWTEAGRKRSEEIRLRVTMKYAAEYARASRWKKWVIDLRIRYEVAKELSARDPQYRL